MYLLGIHFMYMYAVDGIEKDVQIFWFIICKFFSVRWTYYDCIFARTEGSRNAILCYKIWWTFSWIKALLLQNLSTKLCQNIVWFVVVCHMFVFCGCYFIWKLHTEMVLCFEHGWTSSVVISVKQIFQEVSSGASVL